MMERKQHDPLSNLRIGFGLLVHKPFGASHRLVANDGPKAENKMEGSNVVFELFNRKMRNAD